MLPLETVAYRLLWAALLGSLIGVERIRSKRPAGLRTSLFVCMASALFTIVSVESARVTEDPSTTRIASQHLNVSLAGEQHVIQFDADLSQRQQEKIVSRLIRPGLVFDVLPADKHAE